jgi:hypothetical protein
VEELQTPQPGHCHACGELHQELKEALMRYLLSTASMHVYSSGMADPGSKNLELDLSRALLGFHEHRTDTHFSEYLGVGWMGMSARSSS